ncbi:MAG TPA: class I SAM-dependent methyltransferase [Gemmatimonadales bacterium]|nr:class I SAM-dependent methyltransferase [Gemmatimonadales bacterium]
MAPAAPSYALGHSEAELERLIQQSRFFGELTEELFQRAGILPGMRVLDIGCGPGDVSFLAARVVGPSGSVLGVDRSADAIRLARERAAGAGLTNVTFAEGSLDELDVGGEFDALVGRLVLLYLADPAATLRRLRRHLKAGALVVMHEMIMSTAVALPAYPLFENVGWWVLESFRRSGADTEMGAKLLTTFVDAGLPAPQMVMRNRIDGGPGAPTYAALAHLIRSLLPAIERYGVATADEIRIDTLADRLREETVRGRGVVIAPALVGAWAVEPGG